MRPAALIEEAVELMAPRAQAKGIEIASFIDERLPAQVVGDAARLRQVLLNLVGNAIKFTEKGGVAVIGRAGADGSEIIFEVRDTGIGLKTEDLARIFLDFEQADSSSTRKFGGTGLGLAISKRIVERMDGHIAAKSEVGVGTTFTVSVPLLPAPGAQEAVFVAPDLAHTAVMVVAAAEIEASLLARQLGRWGAKTCAVIDENIAAALLPERPWDALLVDYPLASAMIASVNVARLSVPKRIVLIRPTDRHELRALRAAGFTGYLIKPVRAASLAARLTPKTLLNIHRRRPKRKPRKRPLGRQQRTFNPRRGGQRDQRAARACAHQRLGLSVPTWRHQRRRGRPVLGSRPRPSGSALRSGSDGCAHARAGRSLRRRRRIRGYRSGDGRPPTRMVALTANVFQVEDREARARRRPRRHRRQTARSRRLRRGAGWLFRTLRPTLAA